jgi:hypothetical protein
MPVPYFLKPKATKLPEGHDDSLDPPAPPTDAEQRGLEPIDWPAVDASKGGDGPPDAPLAPPAVDSARRSVPAFVWPRVPAKWVPGRSVRETVGSVPGTLDPDIALWQVVVPNIWPFTGAPTEGTWPRGWFGVDNTGTFYVCTVAGEPGTWTAISPGGGGWPTINGSGAGNLEAETGSGDTVGYNLTDQGSGGITIKGAGTGEVTVESTGDAGVAIFDSGAGGIHITGSSTGGIAIASGADASISLLNTSNDPIVIDSATGGIELESGAPITANGQPLGPMTSHAGHLATDYDMTTGLATFLTTASLAVGTWLVTCKGSATVPAGAATEYEANAGTATATFEGAVSDDIAAPDTVIESPFMLQFIATVTVAGTLVFQAIANTVSGGPTVMAATGTNNYPKATGYTAVRIG